MVTWGAEYQHPLSEHTEAALLTAEMWSFPALSQPRISMDLMAGPEREPGAHPSLTLLPPLTGDSSTFQPGPLWKVEERGQRCWAWSTGVSGEECGSIPASVAVFL